MTKLAVETLDNGSTIINMGPQHPSTHGVINFRLKLTGEIIETIDPNVGFLHRGLEKIAEMVPYTGYIPYTDRIDYVSAMFCNQGWCMAVEKLLGLEVPRRAEYLRAIACELNRIINHLLACGSLAMDCGAVTPFLHCIREREHVNDLMEKICGARLTYNYMRFGGVSCDYAPGLDKEILTFIDRFERFLPELNRLITDNEIFVNRLIHLGVIDADSAISYSLGGPNLRASGVDFDLRRDYSYSAYPELKFKVVTGNGYRGEVGDSFARYMVRIDEMSESAKIVRQAIEGLPEGEIQAKVSRNPSIAPGEIYSVVESNRGELGYYVVSNGTDRAFRARIRTGSYTAMSLLQKFVPGLMVADLVAFFGSLDVVAPEVDR
ncbi:MAG: NADH-quinone oxidoreductase subunit D [Candidatus Zhuqueibacterota bacterium]